MFQTDFRFFLAINTLNQDRLFYSNYIFDIMPIWNSKIAFILLKPLLMIVHKTWRGLSVKSPYVTCGATALLSQQLEDGGTWDNRISALKAQAQCIEHSSSHQLCSKDWVSISFERKKKSKDNTPDWSTAQKSIIDNEENIFIILRHCLWQSFFQISLKNFQALYIYNGHKTIVWNLLFSVALLVVFENDIIKTQPHCVSLCVDSKVI